MAIKLGGQAINPQILSKANNTKTAESDGKILAKALKPGESVGNNRGTVQLKGVTVKEKTTTVYDANGKPYTVTVKLVKNDDGTYSVIINNDDCHTFASMDDAFDYYNGKH